MNENDKTLEALLRIYKFKKTTNKMALSNLHQNDKDILLNVEKSDGKKSDAKFWRAC